MSFEVWSRLTVFRNRGLYSRQGPARPSDRWTSARAMSKLSVFTACALSLVATGPTTPAAAQAIERQVIVSAVDADGQPVTGLTAADFVVREDGALREVLRVAPGHGGAPDRSAGGYEPGHAKDRGRPAERRGDLRGGHERGKRDLAHRVRRDARASSPSRPGTSTGCGTAWETSSRPPTRRRIFWMPCGKRPRGSLDGAPSGLSSWCSRHEVSTTALGRRRGDRTAQGDGYRLLLGDLRRADSPAGEPVRLSIEIEQTRIQRDRLLDAGPEETGGRTRYLQSASAASRVMQDLANDLRNQYLLVYARPDTFVPRKPSRSNQRGATSTLAAYRWSTPVARRRLAAPMNRVPARAALRISFASAVVLVACAVITRGQQPPQPPTFRTGIDVVS